MSDSLEGLRRQLNATEQLGSVVRAMKAISASCIVQYDKAVEALGQYQHSLELGLSLCLGEERPVPAASSPALDIPSGALVFGSDQGLVGRFNEVIGEFAAQSLHKLPGPKTVWAVGERACPPLEAAGLTVRKRFAVPCSVAAITGLVTQLQVEIESYTAETRYGEVHVFHNSPRAVARYEAATQRLLPLDAAWYKHIRQVSWPNAQPAEVLGDRATTLTGLIHEQLFISLYRACAESLASENVSRLAAMQRADENIEKVRDDLQRSLNRLRQSSIDEELFDVVAGFSALA
ncbi:MAG TPA: F0F1 ATP synthase subunit gamma [Steroidobacteraceae bacterium]|jgi:F-type H+-transporting ATPase subunit gamma|nr:F0F1 ATP synthase subunit gamma [Steroidobacteraceae bacterium]